MKRQPIRLDNEEILADFDPLVNPKTPALAVVEAPKLEPVEAPVTAESIAKKGVESYLNTWSETSAKYENIGFNEEIKTLMDSILELEELKNKGTKRPSVFKSKALGFQRFATVGMLLMLQAETDTDIKKTFADLFQKSKPAKDR